MSSKKAIVIFLSIVAVIVLILAQIQVPYMLYQLPVFYGVLDEVDELSDSIALESQSTDNEPIECEKAYLDMWDKKSKLTFSILGDEECKVFDSLVNVISSYMKEHSGAYLNKCRLDIEYINMGAITIAARNYSLDGGLNHDAYDFNYCRFNDFDGKLSQLTSYDWVEVLEIGREVKADDIQPLIDMPRLKKILCPHDLLDDKQIKALTDAHRGLKFEFDSDYYFMSN